MIRVKYVPLGVVSSMPLVGEVTLIFVWSTETAEFLLGVGLISTLWCIRYSYISEVYQVQQYYSTLM